MMERNKTYVSHLVGTIGETLTSLGADVHKREHPAFTNRLDHFIIAAAERGVKNLTVFVTESRLPGGQVWTYRVKEIRKTIIWA